MSNSTALARLTGKAHGSQTCVVLVEAGMMLVLNVWRRTRGFLGRDAPSSA